MAGRFKLRVHEPCTEPWGSMAGDDRRRFCGRCSLHVHDLSAMREEAVMKLIAGPDPHLCIRYGVRDDGTAIIGETRLRRALRVAGLIGVSLWFWATVVLVQLPYENRYTVEVQGLLGLVDYREGVYTRPPPKESDFR